MNELIIPVLILGGLGLLFAVLLGIANIIFEVKSDPKVEQVLLVLPGVNCGGCGFASCEAYAKGVVLEGAAPNLCTVGGAPVAKDIGKVLGIKVESKEQMVAYVKCNGDCDKAKEIYDYHGIMDCVSASALPGEGGKACRYGCLGLGTCVSVCDFDAIEIINGVAIINEEKCTNCGACIEACPKDLIESVPLVKRVRVACNSRDTAKDAMQSCEVGCIACRKCERACEFDAIHVVNNIAHIDYEKCTECNACVLDCPKDTIENLLFVDKIKNSLTA